MNSTTYLSVCLSISLALSLSRSLSLSLSEFGFRSCFRSAALCDDTSESPPRTGALPRAHTDTRTRPRTVLQTRAGTRETSSGQCLCVSFGFAGPRNLLVSHYGNDQPQGISLGRGRRPPPGPGPSTEFGALLLLLPGQGPHTADGTATPSAGGCPTLRASPPFTAGASATS